jgi:hypothetical protein
VPADLEDILASPACFALVKQRPNFEQINDFPVDGSHPDLEFKPGERSFFEMMPKTERLLEPGQQDPSNHLGFTTTFQQSLEISFEMRPTHLTLAGIDPIVRAIAIRTGDTGIVFAQQGLGSTGTAALEDAEHGYRWGRTHLRNRHIRWQSHAFSLHPDWQFLYCLLASFFKLPVTWQVGFYPN